MKLLSKSLALTILTTSLAFSSITVTHNTYAAMTTLELQHAVEKHSEAGNLPFEMGLELMKRWTKS